MTQSQEVSHGQEGDFRLSLLDLLWKITLGVVVFALVALMTSIVDAWQWALLPALMGVSSIAAWQLLWITHVCLRKASLHCTLRGVPLGI
jgi:fatty acid desaturase